MFNMIDSQPLYEDDHAQLFATTLSLLQYCDYQGT